MLVAAALLALAGPDTASLEYIVDGSCPTEAEVRRAVEESLATAKATWPGRRLELRLEDRTSSLSLDLKGSDGQIVLERTFRDESRDCAARAEAVGLVVARYLESLGRAGEPPEVGAPVQRRRASPWVLGPEVGAILAGGVADPSGDTALDVGPEVGVRLGRGGYAAALRVAWLPGDSFAEGTTGAAAGVDRIPITLAGQLAGRWGRWMPAAGARLVLEPMRSAGQTPGLRTDTSLAVRAGFEAEGALLTVRPLWVSLRLGVDVAIRRIETRLTDPGTSERIDVLEQDLVVPWLAIGIGGRWNLGRPGRSRTTIDR